MAMTISQTLRRIAKIKGELKECLERAVKSLSYDTEAQPAFSFPEQCNRAGELRTELIDLETKLRLANASNKIKWGDREITLAEATAVLREMKSQIAWLRTLPCQAQADNKHQSAEWDETAEKHVKVTRVLKCDLPEAKRAKLVAEEQAGFDALNDLVETANHTVSV